MRGELAVYFQRPPIGCVPFPIRRVKDFGLLPRCPQDGAGAVGMDLHMVIADEVELVPASHVMKGVVREFELLGSGTKGGNCRGEFQISHQTLLWLRRINATEPRMDTRTPKKIFGRALMRSALESRRGFANREKSRCCQRLVLDWSR